MVDQLVLIERRTMSVVYLRGERGVVYSSMRRDPLCPALSGGTVRTFYSFYSMFNVLVHSQSSVPSDPLRV